jgi:hypothetical protein
VAEGDVPTAIHAIGAGPAKVELRDIGDGHLVAV